MGFYATDEGGVCVGGGGGGGGGERLGCYAALCRVCEYTICCTVSCI